MTSYFTQKFTHETFGRETVYHVQDFSGMDSDQDYTLLIETQHPTPLEYSPDSFNVYITLGRDSSPNQFNFDYLFKNVGGNGKQLRLNKFSLGNLSKEDTDGFAIAVEVNGFLEA